MRPLNESTVEEACLEWFASLGYEIIHGPTLAPGEPGAERATYGDVVLEKRLRKALERINPDVSPEALDEAFNKLTRIAAAQLIDGNHELHTYLVGGVSVEYIRPDGSIGYTPVRVLDADDVDANDWLVVNQYTVSEHGNTRRPDVVVFVNGLPLAIFELKHPTAENVDIHEAYSQLQTYQQEIPTLFTYNVCLVLSNGVRDALIGTLSSPFERFAPWRSIDSEELAPGSRGCLITRPSYSSKHPSRARKTALDLDKLLLVH